MATDLLSDGIAQARAGDFECFRYLDDAESALSDCWPSFVEVQAASYDQPLTDADLDVHFSDNPKQPSSWSVAFTPNFRKSVAAADKKIQGRIFVALAELSETPDKCHGDTVKPLSGSLKGKWRYRIGHYRLVYEPQVERRVVVLLHFAGRGEVYD